MLPYREPPQGRDRNESRLPCAAHIAAAVYRPILQPLCLASAAHAAMRFNRRKDRIAAPWSKDSYCGAGNGCVDEHVHY
jgi:hypothetical protein